MSNDDQQIIRECLNGSPESFGRLVERYQDRLFHTLLGTLGSTHEARDAAQDAFVLAFEKLDSFRGDSAFYSWLFRIAMNAAITQKRKTRRTRASLDAAYESSGVEPVDQRADAEPSHDMEVQERQSMVRAALAELPEEFRTALVLKEMEGLKYDEIAEVVGCPIGTVRSRIHRARSELRGKLEVILKRETE